MIGINPPKRKFSEGQVVLIDIKITNVDSWLNDTAGVCYFITGKQKAMSDPVWDTDINEWKYHITCLDGRYEGWEAYIKESFLTSNTDTQEKQKEIDKRKFWKRWF